MDCLDHPLHRGGALANRDVDAHNIRILLIDDGVNGDCRLAGRTVANDELALTTADREQRIDDGIRSARQWQRDACRQPDSKL